MNSNDDWIPLGDTGLEARRALLDDPRTAEQVAEILDDRTTYCTCTVSGGLVAVTNGRCTYCGLRYIG